MGELAILVLTFTFIAPLIKLGTTARRARSGCG